MSRFTRACVLFMHVTIFMFVCVVTTVYILHDDGTCYTYVNEAQCHATPGRFDVSITYCEYNYFENTCYLRIPYDNPFSVAFAFAFAYLATSPLNILCDWAIKKIITADEVAEELRAIDDLIKDDMAEVAAQGKDAVRKSLLKAHGASLVNVKRSGKVAPMEALGILVPTSDGHSGNDVKGLGLQILQAINPWSRSSSADMRTSKVSPDSGVVNPWSPSSSVCMSTAKVSPDPNAATVLSVGPDPTATIVTHRENYNDGESSASSLDDYSTGKQRVVKQRNQRRLARIKQEGGYKKRSKKSRDKTDSESNGEHNISRESWQEIKQRKLEERVLGSTLEEDLAKWNDAIRLYRTMSRLGTDEDGVVDAALYGPSFKKYFEVQERIRIREKTRYRMFDKNGKFQWPKQSHYNRWFNRFFECCEANQRR